MAHQQDLPLTALILGAGFSHAAGMPLTRDLLSGDTYVPSKTASKKWSSLLDDYEAWFHKNPGKGVEQYLAELYSIEFGYRAELWSVAVHLITATLGTPRHGESVAGRARYSSMITRGYRDAAHRAFWDVILKGVDLTGVVTTNYDILIERSLRHRPMTGRPGFHYGGFPVPMKVLGWEDPFAGARRKVTVIEGRVPVCKLHGSVNWFVDHGSVHIHTDARHAFSLRNPCAIVPPTPEKRIPGWLEPVWVAARECLSSAHLWIVCGYSLPDYDIQVRDLLGRITPCPETVILMVPHAERDKNRWKDLLHDATIVTLPGLPEGVDVLRDLLPPEPWGQASGA